MTTCDDLEEAVWRNFSVGASNLQAGTRHGHALLRLADLGYSAEWSSMGLREMWYVKEESVVSNIRRLSLERDENNLTI